MREVRQRLAEEVSGVLGIEVEQGEIEIPENVDADFAYPAMKAASRLEEPPGELAADVADSIELEWVEAVEVGGPGYVNFYLQREWFGQRIVETLEEEKMGVEQREGSVLIEFSSPNVAKPMHVGHLRNNALGDSLQRILRSVGYEVTSENYLGDWGTQYGKLIHAFKEFGSEEEFEDNPMEHMYELYVKFHEEMEDDEKLEEKGREWAARIEEGDEEAVRLWEMFRKASVEHHMRDYSRMGVEFDRVTGESTVVEGARELVERGVEEGVFEEDEDGSLYVEFEDLPDTVVLKKDGSTLYLTRDLENLRKRKEDEGFDQNIIVTGSEQELHFRQVFRTCEKLGIDTEGCENVTYGLLSLPEGSMSSREGRIVRLSGVLDEAVERAREEAEEKVEREVENAEAIGIGAVKFSNLSVSRKKNVEFSWENALSFKGNSGPYLQYSNVRAKSILDRAKTGSELAGRPGDEEYSLLKRMSEFPAAVEEAAERREPATLANYLESLCEEFNSFYHSCPVLDADGERRERRLKLVELFATVTDEGMELLGIEPLDRM